MPDDRIVKMAAKFAKDINTVCSRSTPHYEALRGVATKIESLSAEMYTLIFPLVKPEYLSRLECIFCKPEALIEIKIAQKTIVYEQN